MDTLLFVFAFLASFSFLAYAMLPDEKKPEGKLVSLRDLVSTKKLCMYSFLIFFLLVSLQINVAYGSFASSTITNTQYTVITYNSPTQTPANIVSEVVYPSYTTTNTLSANSSVLSLGSILTFIAGFLLFIALLSDVIQILVFSLAWINNRR